MFLGVEMPAGMDPLVGLCGRCVCVCLRCKKSDRYMGTSAGWSNVFKLLAPQLFSPVAKWCLLSVAVPGGALVSGCAGHRDLSFSHGAA